VGTRVGVSVSVGVTIPVGVGVGNSVGVGVKVGPIVGVGVFVGVGVIVTPPLSKTRLSKLVHQSFELDTVTVVQVWLHPVAIPVIKEPAGIVTVFVVFPAQLKLNVVLPDPPL
jgi:hypothetical protein